MRKVDEEGGGGGRKKGEISLKGERRTEQGDKLRDKFELLLGLLRATARIQDSVNYAPKCFIIKHFAVLIVAPTIATGNETRKETVERKRRGKGAKVNNARATRKIHRNDRMSE